MSFFGAFTRKRGIDKARQLLNEGMRKLPDESLIFFQEAKQRFSDAGDTLMAQTAEAHYYKAVGKIHFCNHRPEEALQSFNASREIFVRLSMLEEVGELNKCISKIHGQLGDLEDMKREVGAYISAVNLARIDFEEASRICVALEIDGDTLNMILSELESEGLLKYTGDSYAVIKDKVQRVEIEYGQKPPTIEPLKCPVCCATLKNLDRITECPYCGATLRINIPERRF